jgi:hypothetical protein
VFRARARRRGRHFAHRRLPARLRGWVWTLTEQHASRAWVSRGLPGQRSARPAPRASRQLDRECAAGAANVGAGHCAAHAGQCSARGLWPGAPRVHDRRRAAVVLAARSGAPSRTHDSTWRRPGAFIAAGYPLPSPCRSRRSRQGVRCGPRGRYGQRRGQRLVPRATRRPVSRLQEHDLLLDLERVALIELTVPTCP